MTAFFQKYIAWFLFAVVIVLLVLYMFFPKTKTIINTVTQIDTVESIHYEEVVKVDTVKKWYEVTKEIEVPSNIYIQKIDTQIVIKFKEYDLMISVKKKANKDLIIYVLNQERKLLKEYVYHDVADVFDITSQQNNIKVKSSNLQWNNVGFYGEHSSTFTWGEHDYDFGAKTGFNWNDKINLDVKAGYNTTLKDFRLKQDITVYPFR